VPGPYPRWRYFPSYAPPDWVELFVWMFTASRSQIDSALTHQKRMESNDVLSVLASGRIGMGFDVEQGKTKMGKLPRPVFFGGEGTFLRTSAGSWQAGGMPVGSPELIVRDAVAWRGWLRDHQVETDGVWLVLAKKGVTEPTSITYDEALEEALCQGWIDGQVRRRDEATYVQRFTPRRRRSPWSQRNVALAERLAAEGRMQPAGAAEIDRAKGDGRWQAAYAGPAGAGVPADLAQALAASPRARAMFEILTSQNRYSVIHRITTAKRADTRARRIEQFVAMLERGETPYPQRRTLDVRP